MDDMKTGRRGVVLVLGMLGLPEAEGGGKGVGVADGACDAASVRPLGAAGRKHEMHVWVGMGVLGRWVVGPSVRIRAPRAKRHVRE